MNVFKVNEIIADNSDVTFGAALIMRYTAHLDAVLEIRCDAHNNLLGSINIKTTATAMDMYDAVRTAIEKLLNNSFNTGLSVYLPRCECAPKLGNMRYDFSSLHDRWRELFEELFSDSGWQPALALEQ